MLKEEYSYYLEHQAELLEKYEGKFLVIKNKNIIGVYNNQEDAYNESKKTNELGSFLIQLCSRDLGTATQTFHSRVSFAH